MTNKCCDKANGCPKCMPENFASSVGVIIDKLLKMVAKITPPRPTYPPSRTAPLEQRIAELERERDQYKDLWLNRDLSLGVTYRDKVEQQVCPKCNQEMGNPHHCRPDWSGPSIGGKEVSDEH